MTIVLDASGAIEIALENSLSKQFKEILQKADLVIAPDTFISEVTNIFWKYRKFSYFIWLLPDGIVVISYLWIRS